MNYEELKKANESILTTDIQGKKYAEVNQRIKAFRMCYPEGLIQTELVSLENGVAIFRAYVYAEADGKLLATGTAYEKENSSFINKTSYIENCETSAIGRALGIAGFGIDASVASAEEVQNAINNQGDHPKPPKKPDPKSEPKAAPKTERKISDSQISIISKIYEGRIPEMLEHYGLEKIEDMSMTLASRIIASKAEKKGTEQ